MVVKEDVPTNAEDAQLRSQENEHGLMDHVPVKARGSRSITSAERRTVIQHFLRNCTAMTTKGGSKVHFRHAAVGSCSINKSEVYWWKMCEHCT